MDKAFLDKLDELRLRWKAPLLLNSAWRCPIHNAKINGAQHSQHLLGKAVDIRMDKFTGEDRHKLMKLAFELGFKGVALGPKASFLHVDMRDSAPTVWTY
jgi:zinc D-Ala-D-Ala carboxypeptidase